MRVRPSIRRALRIVLPILVLVGGLQLWDDYQVRRVQALLQRVDEARRPVPPSTPVGADDAGRFYAGAIAAVYYEGATPFALRDTSAGDLIRQNDETLRMLDRGAELPLRQISGIAETSQIGRTIQVERAAAARTALLVEQGDTDAAVRALINEILFLRAFGDGDLNVVVRTNALRRVTSEFGLFLSRLTLSPSDVVAIDDAFAQVYEGDALRHRLVGSTLFRLQAYQFGRLARPSSFAVMNPFRLFLLESGHAMLQTTARALDAAARPWPDAIVAMDALEDSKPLVTRAYAPLWTIAPVLKHVARMHVEGLARVRACRAALAAYARSTVAGDEAIDPFSGTRIVVSETGSDVAVYSVGPNRRDDGGAVAVLSRQGGSAGRQSFAVTDGDTPDIGLRFTRAPRR